MIAPPGLMLYFWVYVEVLGWLWIAGLMLWLSSWCWAVGMIPTLDCCEPDFAILCGSSDGPLLYWLQFSVYYPSLISNSWTSWILWGGRFLSWIGILVQMLTGYSSRNCLWVWWFGLFWCSWWCLGVFSSYPLCWQLALPVTSPLPLPTLYLS